MKNQAPLFSRHVAAIVSVAATTAAIACAAPLGLNGGACPCLDGFTCCNEECIPDEDVDSNSGSCVSNGASSSSTSSSSSGTPRNPDASPESSSSSLSSGGLDTASQRAIVHNESPLCLTQDAAHLYWLNANGTISGVLKTGGPVVHSLFVPPTQPIARCGLVVDGDSLYATMYGQGTIVRVSISSSTPTGGVFTIGDKGALFGAFLTPSSMAMDASYIYVTELDSGAVKSIDRAAAALDGSAPTTPVVTNLGTAGSQPHDIVVNGDSLYWLDDGGLRQMPKVGGHIVTLSDTTNTGDLIVANGQLVWRFTTTTTQGFPTGQIWAMTLPNGTPHALTLDSPKDSKPGLTEWLSDISGLATDGQKIVFADVVRFSSVPFAGGIVTKEDNYVTPTTLHGFAVDVNQFFWIDDTTVWGTGRPH